MGFGNKVELHIQQIGQTPEESWKTNALQFKRDHRDNERTFGF